MRYIRPDESLRLSPVTGTVDADFEADWLTDGRFGVPVMRTGALSLTVTPGDSPDPEIDLIAVCHHNIAASASVTLGGSLSGGMTPPDVPADGIPLNFYRLLTAPVSVATLVLGVTGPVDVVIGELYAGLSRTLEAPLRLGRVTKGADPFAWEPDSLIPPNDSGLSDVRRVSGDCVLTESGLADVDAWYASTRRGTRPTLIVLDEAINDAWVAIFRYEAQTISADVYPDALYQVTFEFVEVPRVRW